MAAVVGVTLVVVPPAEATSGRWTGIGPAIATPDGLAISRSDPDVLYLVYGGLVYRTVDAGSSWHPLRSNYPKPAHGAIAVDPVDPMTAYLVDVGIFKTTDGGRTWKDSDAGIRGSVVEIAVAPTDPSRVYAATTLGVSASVDGGQHWTNSLDLNHGSYFVALAVDPTDPNTLYVTSDELVSKSIDGGTTWNPANQGLSADATIESLTIDPSDAQVVYAGMSWAGGKNHPEAARSSDGGATWSLIPLRATRVFDVTVDAGDPTKLYAATNEGVFDSTDAGDSWSRLTNGIPGGIARIVRTDPSREGIAYVGSTRRNGLYKTNDGGASWTAAVGGISAGCTGAPAIDAGDPQILYIGFGGGLKSMDGGPWEPDNRGLPPAKDGVFLTTDPARSGTLYAYGSIGVFKSVDWAATWREADKGIPSPSRFGAYTLAIAPSEPDTVYVGTFYGAPHVFFRSVDGGRAWSEEPFPVSDPIMALAVDPIDPNVVWVATQGYPDGVGRIFKSSDTGATWTDVLDFTEGGYAYGLRFVIDPNDPGIVHIAVSDYTTVGGVWATTDGGTTWSQQYAAVGVTDIVADPAAPSMLYLAAGPGGVLTSGDGGASWVPINDGLPPNAYVSTVSIDHNGSAVYVGACPFGVYRRPAF